jgi:hypothetical protein
MQRVTTIGLDCRITDQSAPNLHNKASTTIAEILIGAIDTRNGRNLRHDRRGALDAPARDCNERQCRDHADRTDPAKQ